MTIDHDGAAMNSLNASEVWTDSLKILPILQTKTSGSDSYGDVNVNNQQQQKQQPSALEINIASFNILAESYLTPRSHKNLPHSYANIVFNKDKRRKLLCDVIATRLAKQFDILCLQEVDNILFPIISKCLQELGFGFIFAPRGQDPTISASDDSIHLLEEKEKKKEKEEKMKNINTTDSRRNEKKKKNVDSRSDGCATFYKLSKWSCQDYEVVQFDDLANDKRPSIDSELTLSAADTEISTSIVKEFETQIESEEYSSTKKEKTSTSKRISANHALPGIIASYKRCNTALILRLRSNSSLSLAKQLQHDQNDIIIGNAHLYWHPGYEFVKLSQAHYLMHRIKCFLSKDFNGGNNLNRRDIKTQNICVKSPPAVIICGDMNSKPNSAVHQYFTKGFVDARTIAPWYYQYDENEEEEFSESQLNGGENNVTEDSGDIDQDPIVDFDVENEDNDLVENSKPNDDSITSAFQDMDLLDQCDDTGKTSSATNPQRAPKRYPSYEEFIETDNSSSPCYLLDITLNKFTRWLRILGLDAELETEAEEKARTGGGEM